ncbi:MAG: hydrogenase maturation protease [Thermoleophilia bacterium]|nr:hydrogenase maturation protease [Thermoleophilia bacterium]
MADDGVGVAVVEGFDPGSVPPGVELVTGATAGMALIRYFLDYDLVIAVDAIDCGASPGAIFKFHPDEAGIMNLRSNNIHGMGLPYLITSARLKGIDPEVLVFAVQVGNVMPRDGGLSAEVAAAAIRVRGLIEKELTCPGTEAR